MKNKTKENSIVSSELIKNTLIISLFSIVGKVLGAVFKIPLTNVVGAEGMGYYQIVFPIFVLLFTLSSCGVSTAVTIKIAENKKALRHFEFKGFLYCVLFSIFFAILLCLFASLLAKLQGNVLAFEIYYFVSIAIIGVSLLNLFKSVLRGIECFVSYAVAETIEQITKVILSLLLATLFIKQSIIKSIDGVFVGITMSTIFAIVYCLFAIKKYTNKNNINYITKLQDSELSDFNKLAFLSTIGLIVIPIIQFVDSILIVNLLQKYGSNVSESTSLFGLSRGTVSTLLNLPTVAIVSLEFVLLPLLIKNKNANDNWSMTAKRSIFITLVICSPFLFLYLFFPTEIINLLYENSLTKEQLIIAVELLKIGALGIVFAGLLQVSCVVLQGMKNVVCPILALSVAGIIKIVLLLVLIPKVGILGAEVANVGFYIAATIIVLYVLYFKRMNYQSTSFFIPLLLAGCVMLFIRYFYNILVYYISAAISLFICGVVGACIYGVILILFRKVFETNLCK